jgi:hypothetical protein
MNKQELAEAIKTIKKSDAKEVNATLIASGVNWGIYIKPLTGGGGDGDNDSDDGVGGIQDDPTHGDA